LQDNIFFFSEDINFELLHPKTFIVWIRSVILKENSQVGDLNFIFCSDEYLYDLNLKHLNHNTYTDIITFNYCENDLISGDIFISIDRIRDNSLKFSKLFNDELSRVIIHGVLHLVGYDDKLDEDQTIMRAKEDFYLTLQ
jgi:rRNA maturation RNase YbeY